MAYLSQPESVTLLCANTSRTSGTTVDVEGIHCQSVINIEVVLKQNAWNVYMYIN